MIERMKYVNIAGPLRELDRVIEQYITRCDIQLDYAMSELSDIGGLMAITDANPYAALLQDVAFIRTGASLMQKNDEKLPLINKNEAIQIIKKAAEHFKSSKDQVEALNLKIDLLTELVDNLTHFVTLDFKVDDLAAFKHIDYRFGKMPLAGFKQFETYLYDDSMVIFETADNDGEYVWCVYFAPHSAIKREDVIFSSLHFNVLDFPKEYEGELLKGTPLELKKYFEQKLSFMMAQKSKLETDLEGSPGVSMERLAAACAYIEREAAHFDYRKYAGLTNYDYFVFVGWMPAKQAYKLSGEMADDENLTLVVENVNNSIRSEPPSRLKNNVLFRPFEYLVRMYGVPRYDEIDPTPFVAVTYSLFYGMMFGDVGQGAVLSLFGLYLYKVRKVPLGGILAIVGLFSVFFGFMYGSIFGLEDILPALWLSPSHDIMTLVITAVSLGGVTIVVCMILSIINAIKTRDIGRLLFDQSGVAGVVLYLSVVAYALVTLLTSSKVHIVWVLTLIVLPLILIAFKEPLGALVDKKRKREEIKSVGMFIFTSLMELVEVVLSFFTNTLSFVRIAGYAISHAGLMSVVIMLSGGDSGSVNIPGVIFGNLFVMGLEGLIVFIQVMRLQYYEMFSRYYKGGGKEFAATRIGTEADKAYASAR